MKNTPLSEQRKREIMAVIEDIHKRSNGRPCMVIIRLVDGIPQIYEAGQPVRAEGKNHLTAMI